MKLFVISDNTDTKMGLRLCGIEGVVVNDEPSFRAEVEKCLSDSEIGILLVTEKLVKLTGLNSDARCRLSSKFPTDTARAERRTP